MPRYLGQSAGCTFACPCAAIFPHSRPHKPLGHQLGGGVGPGVAKALEGVKDLASERRCYKWPRLWRGRVAMTSFPGMCACSNRSAEPFSERLAAPHSDPVNSQEHGNKEAS